MPARYRIYTELSFVHTVAYGELRGEEMLATHRARVICQREVVNDSRPKAFGH